MALPNDYPLMRLSVAQTQAMQALEEAYRNYDAFIQELKAAQPRLKRAEPLFAQVDAAFEALWAEQVQR